MQSNVSEQIRQLERELGVPVLVRGRRGATPTEFGRVVLERARRIRGELEAMRVDLSLLQGLEAGHASLGVVGTASRWLVPALVGDLRQRAPGVMLRINEGASERLAAEVVSHELTMAVVTEPIVDPRLTVEHLLEEDLVGLVPEGLELPPEPVPFATMAGLSLILPPSGNPFRLEIDPPPDRRPPRAGRAADGHDRRDAAPPPGAGDRPPRLPLAGRPGGARLRPPPRHDPPGRLGPPPGRRRNLRGGLGGSSGPRSHIGPAQRGGTGGRRRSKGS